MAVLVFDHPASRRSRGHDAKNQVAVGIAPTTWVSARGHPHSVALSRDLGVRIRQPVADALMPPVPIPLHHHPPEGRQPGPPPPLASMAPAPPCIVPWPSLRRNNSAGREIIAKPMLLQAEERARRAPVQGPSRSKDVGIVEADRANTTDPIESSPAGRGHASSHPGSLGGNRLIATGEFSTLTSTGRRFMSMRWLCTSHSINP